MAQYDVLIVEDEMIIAIDIKRILTSKEYRVVGIARDIEQAFALAEKHRPQLAIVDIKLANDINGLTVGRELKERFGTEVIFATATPGPAAVMARDVSETVVCKPFKADDLLGAIASHLSKVQILPPAPQRERPQRDRRRAAQSHSAANLPQTETESLQTILGLLGKPDQRVAIRCVSVAEALNMSVEKTFERS
jgi:DNA-binding response OmpR family regulator